MRRSMNGIGRSEVEDAGGRRYFLDRSKLRVLLCDTNPKSSQEILRLLHNCSYKVTTVRTPRQVIDMLTTRGAEIDIVLTEIDLPVTKGLKMLKCVARKKELRHIPIIMMSSQDEVSVIVKCLRLGAADYLVKPLRTNELLNLWTHSWRRRRMFGLAEKDNFNQEIELILSDHSDANTNSTILLSEDTDDRTKRTHPEIIILDQDEHELDTSPVEPNKKKLTETEDDTLQDADHAVFSGQKFSCSILKNNHLPVFSGQKFSCPILKNNHLPVFSGQKFSCPRKTNLKFGESSAFFTYSKSSAPTSNSHLSHVDQDVTQSEHLNAEENIFAGGKTDGCSSREVPESYSLGNSFPISENAYNTHREQAPTEVPMVCHASPSEQSHSRTEGQRDVPGLQPIFHLPIYLHGQPLPMQGYHGTSYDLQRQNPPSLLHLPQYNGLPQSHHAPMMHHFAYHPVGISLPSGHTPPTYLWPSSTSSHAPQSKSGLTERRAAALMKFKKKKMDRCYDKKIRYVNRKRLAEKRPRVRGQFVRQVNGAVDQLNGSPVMEDYDSDEEEYEPLSK